MVPRVQDFGAFSKYNVKLKVIFLLLANSTLNIFTLYSIN